MWHIVAIGYLFVAVMYSAAQPSIARALIYLVFWVVLPTVFTVFAVTVRRRNRLMGQQEQESGISGKAQNLKGADYVVTGDVTEFGRRDVGDHQLFGILGRGKSQIAYAKVALNIVNVNTSEIVYSTQGAGEYALSNREIIGFGGTSGYDATLNGKVLDLAIREAVDNLVQAVDNGAWQSNR